MGTRNVTKRVRGVQNACGHWGRRWSSPWGREACEWCATMGAVGTCERIHWGIRWSPHYEATKRANGAPKWLTDAEGRGKDERREEGRGERAA
eukprot:505972-Pyramimonas_sp.AAC.1